MKNLRRIVVGAVLGSIAVLTGAEAQAQPAIRTLRFIRATVSPTFDVQGVYTAGPPPGPVVATESPVALGPAQYAEIRVMLPDGAAQVRINGQDIGQQGGMERTFQTPPLQPGWAYTFHVTAHINGGGQPIVHERRIAVLPGEEQLIDFRRGPSTTPVNAPN